MPPATDVRGLPPLTDAERAAIVERIRSVPLKNHGIQMV